MRKVSFVAVSLLAIILMVGGWANAAPTISITNPSVPETVTGPVTYGVIYSGAANITLSTNNITLNRIGTANGTVSVSGFGRTFRTVTISNITGKGILGISIAAGTATGGGDAPAAGPSTTFMVNPPTIAISDPSVPYIAVVPVAGSVTYTITYGSQSAITLADANVTLNLTGNVTADAPVVSGAGNTRTVTIGNILGDGTIGISVAAGTASDGFNTAPAAGPSKTVRVATTFDLTISPPSPAITNKGPVKYTVTYVGALAITLDATKVTVNKEGTADYKDFTVTPTSDPNVFLVTINETKGDGKLSITVGDDTATDLLGALQPGEGPSEKCTIDNTRPTVAISLPDQHPTSLLVLPGDPAPYRQGAITYKLVFSEEITNLAPDDLVFKDMTGLWEDNRDSKIENHIFCAKFPSGAICNLRNISIIRTDVKEYLVTLYPSRDCTVTFFLRDKAVMDLATNESVPSAESLEVAIDDAPRPRFERLEPEFTNSPTIHYLIEFSEPIYGFGTGDVLVDPIGILGTAGGNKTSVVLGAGEPGPISIGSIYELGISGMTYSGYVRPFINMHSVYDADFMYSDIYQTNRSSNDNCTSTVAQYDGTLPDDLVVTLPLPAVGNPANPTTGIVADPNNSQKGSYTTGNPVIDIAGFAHDDMAITGVTWTNDRGGSNTCLKPQIIISNPSVNSTTGSTVSFTVIYRNASNVYLYSSDITANVTGTVIVDPNNITVTETNDPNVYYVTLTGITGIGTLGITVRGSTAYNSALDFATNATSAVAIIGTAAPAISISLPSKMISNTIPVRYSVTYTGATARTLDISDVVLNTTGSANGTISVAPTTDQNVYTVTISNITGDGTLGFSIGGGTAVDANGNYAEIAGPSTPFSTGIEAWSAESVPLQPGRNIITIAASDAAGNALNYELTVTSNNPFWGNEVDIYGIHTSIAVDKSGKPRIAYYDNGPSNLNYAAWDGENWIIQIVDGAGVGSEGASVGYYASLELDANDNPHISYYDATNTNLKYAYLTAGGVWIIQTVDGTSSATDNVGYYTSLALDDIGRPRISYYDVTNRDLKYAQGSAADNPVWTRYTIDSAGDVGQYSSLALDSTFKPRISYYDVTNGDLKYVEGSTAVNPAWTIAPAIDSVDNVGQYTSMALDRDNSPVISYYDSTNRDLKYAAWDGAAWVISIVDSNNQVGRYSSLALNSDDLPAIAYYDATDGDLKYAEGSVNSLNPVWTISVLDDGKAEDNANRYDVGSFCSLAFYNDNPHICYYDNSNYNLKYRYRTGNANGSRPTCIVTPPGSPANADDAPLNFTLTFSAPVTNLDAAKISVINGNKGALTQIAPNGTTYQLVVLPIADPNGRAEVSCTVLAGAARLINPANPLENLASNTATVDYDGGNPTVSIDQMFTQSDPATVLPVKFSIAFSEPVVGFDGEDIVISGSAGGTKTVIVTGSGTHYNASVFGATTTGSIIATIAANVCTDEVGNSNFASTSTNNTVWYDGTRPTCTINKAATQNNPTNSDVINFTATFSEPVWRFSYTSWDKTLMYSYYGQSWPGGINIDTVLTIGGDASFVDGSGRDLKKADITPIGLADAFGHYQSYNVAISGMTGRGTVTVSIPAGAAYDCGNTTNYIIWANEPSTNFDNSNSVVYDATRPTVTIDRKSDQPSPTKDQPIRFTVSFSKDMVDFTEDDVILSSQDADLTLAKKVVTGSGSNYTVEVSGIGYKDTTNTGSVTVMADIFANAVNDAAGNGNLKANSGNNGNVVLFDNRGPSVTVNQAAGQSDSAWSPTINYTVIFSEPVTDFGNNDIIIGGTAGAASAAVTQIAPNDGTRYNAAVSGMTSDGTVTVSVGNGRAQDSLGNLNVASTSTDNTVYYFSEKCAVDVPLAIPDNNSGGVDSIIDLVNQGGVITDLNVKLSITHGSDSDLTAILIGPDGTQVELFSNVGSGGANFTNTVLDDEAGSPLPVNGATAPFTASYRSKDLLSNFDGKSVNGSWRLNVIDNKAGVSGSLVNWCMQFTVSDATGPTVRIDQASDQNDPTNNQTVKFTAVFSNPVTGFSETDVTIDGTAGGEVLSVTPVVNSGDTVFDVVVGNMNSSGTVIASIPAGVATDATNNTNLASTSSDNTVTYDNVRPTVTVNQMSGQADPVIIRLANFVAVFSEPVINFGSNDVVISGTALATSAVVTEIVSAGGTKNGTTFKISVTDMVKTGTVIATISAGVATDIAGNYNLASTSTDNSVTYQQLDVTINQAPSPQKDPTNASPINFTVKFLRGVSDFTTGDVLLSGTAGATTAIVSQIAPNNGTTYNVAVSGMVRPGTVIASIPANKAFDGNYGNTASTSTDNTVTYDNVAPTVTINREANQANPTGGATIKFTVVFSELVTGFATGDVTLTGTAGAKTATVTGSGTTYNVTVTGMTTSGNVTATIAAGVAKDAAGNGNAQSTSTDNTVNYDIERPGVTINQAAGQADPSTDTSIDFTVVFAEPVTGFTASDVSVTSAKGYTNITVTPNDAGAHTTYNVAVNGILGSGKVIASIAADKANDAAGNGNTASSSTDNEVIFDDGKIPTVVLQQAIDQADPTNANSINFTVTFSEIITDFLEEDVEISGTAGATDVKITGSDDLYNVMVTGMANTGDVTISIPAASVKDLVGNDNEASTSPDDTVTYDITAPTATVTKSAGQAEPVEASVINYTIVFSEPVTGFGMGDVTLGGTAGASTVIITEVNAAGGSKDGTKYSAAVSGMFRDGTVTLSVKVNAAKDMAGNNSLAAGPVTINYVHPGLRVTINQAPTQADPTRDTSIKYIVVFSKPVADFTKSDIMLTGTTSGTKVITVTGSGATYNVTVTGMTKSGTIILNIPANVVHDSVGVGNFVSTSTDNTVTFDAERPTVTINQTGAQADPTNVSPINYRVVFSETVTGFATGDVQIGGTAGATTAVVTGSGTTYNVAVSGMVRFGTVILTIPASVAKDGLNNTNVASTSTDNTVTYDQEEPKVTINQATGQADPTMASPVLYTVVFTKAVTGFTSVDVALGGTAGAKTAVVTDSGNHKTYTVKVSGMTKSGTVIPSIPAGAAEDSMGIANQASTFTDNTVTYNKPGPSVTVNQANDQVDPTKDTLISYKVVFAAPVTGFTAGDVKITGTAGATTAVLTGSGAAYTVSISGMTKSGTVIVSLAAGAAQDSSGSLSLASTSTDNSVTFSNAGPKATFSLATGQTNPTKNSKINLAVAFSETVTDFTAGDVVLTGTAGAATAVVTGTGKTYNIAITGMTKSGSVTATIPADKVHNAANDGNAGADYTITYDITVPVIAINFPTNAASCTRNTAKLKLGGTASDNNGVSTVTWSSAKSGSGACTGKTAWSVSDINVAASGDTITVTVKDAAGNTAKDTIAISIMESLPGDSWISLAMISLPIIPDDTDPKLEVGFDANSWVCFNTQANEYAKYPDAETFLTPAANTPGRGFWARFSGAEKVPCGIVPPQNLEATIHLVPGWNMIGQPFISPVKWDMNKLKVKVGNNSSRLLANSTDVVREFAYGFDPTSGAYYLVYDQTILPEAVGSLAPWQAYWLYASKECDFIMPAP